MQKYRKVGGTPFLGTKNLLFFFSKQSTKKARIVKQTKQRAFLIVMDGVVRYALKQSRFSAQLEAVDKNPRDIITSCPSCQGFGRECGIRGSSAGISTARRILVESSQALPARLLDRISLTWQSSRVRTARDSLQFTVHRSAS